MRLTRAKMAQAIAKEISENMALDDLVAYVYECELETMMKQHLDELKIEYHERFDNSEPAA